MTIENIDNGESGLDVRNKLNTVISEVNSLGTVATQDADDVALTGGSFVGADRLGLDTTGGLVPDKGEFVWDADNQTALLGLNGSTLDLGQETHYHVRNNSGTTIPKGTAVRATGTIGMSGRITVAPMIADGSIPAKFFLGITREAIANGEDGKVTHFGKVRGINTNAFDEGDVLYVSPTSAGALTNVEPSSTQLKLPVAFVVTKSATVGAVQVRVTVSATIEQGQKADSAVQPGDLATVATSGDYSDLLNPPALFDGSYNSLSNVPSEFTPAAHTHVLADITDAGTAAAADTGDFATSAQGSLADTAVQPGDLATVATTGDYDDLSNLPTLGTAAAANTGDFAPASHTHALSDLTQSGATDGQVVTWDNALGQWVADDAAGGGATDYVRTRSGTTQDIFDLVDTWNDAATTFTAIKMNVTDTASAAASSLLDLQVGGVSRLRLQKNGNLFSSCLSASTISATHIRVFAGLTTRESIYLNSANNDVGFSGPLIIGGNTANTTAARIFGGGNHTIDQRNLTNAQTFNIYNTFTNATNYERARLGWAGNAFEIKPEADGTGTVRVLHISGLPTSNPGPGILWNDGGDVKVGT